MKKREYKAEYKHMRKKIKIKSALKHSLYRVVAVMLCLSMIAAVLCGMDIMVSPVSAAASVKKATQGTLLREADPSTMDTYREMVNLLSDTRSAGRLWTDKSVFASEQEISQTIDESKGLTRTFDGRDLYLTASLDGVDETLQSNLDNSHNNFTVRSTADFLEVFSALGSSVHINEKFKNPIDLVIVLDMSGSMAWDVNDDVSKHSGEVEPRRQHSRVYQTLDAINKSIDFLMAQNETNRVAVVAYGLTAATLLPLGHYEKISTESYLTVGDFTTYEKGTFPLSTNSNGTYTVRAHATKIEKNQSTEVDNRVRNGYRSSDTTKAEWKNATLVGYHTDLQAGIYKGFDELYSNYRSVEDVTYTYYSEIYGKTITVPRTPVAFVMTDGGSNYALKTNSSSSKATGDEWYNLPLLDEIPDDLTTNPAGYDGNYKKYRSEVDSTYYSTGPILDVLLTASFMKSKVFNRYNALLQNSDVAEQYLNNLHFSVNTISVDTPEDKWQIPRVYSTLDPRLYFNSDPPTPDNFKNKASSFEAQKDDITSAYALWESWMKLANGSGGSVTAQAASSGSSGVTYPINTLPQSGYTDDNKGTDVITTVTNQDIINNINYNDSFSDVSAGTMMETFTELVNNINQVIFTPVSGSNGLGISDSVTFMDPIGKYMEVKDVKKLLLFGRIYNITKAAAYSYNFNESLLKSARADEFKDTGTDGKSYLKEGWYKGDLSDLDNLLYGGADKYPKADGGTGNDLFTDKNDAWDAGWVYRVNAKTAATFVPSLENVKDSLDGEDVSVARMRSTEYTFYRLNLSEDNRNDIQINPVYPQKEQPVITDLGAYRLSDLRIWVEDSGDFSESTGGLASDTSFDRALWINVPSNMIPLRTVNLTQDVDDTWTYESNIPAQDPVDSVTENSPESSSFPLRVFYDVGIEDDLLTGDRRVDTAKVSAEYSKNNRASNSDWALARGLDGLNETTKGVGSLEFFANWYNPENRYDSYVTNDIEYSYGDPAVTFSPSDENSYYLFQRPLPLYKTAYRYTDNGTWEPVDTGEGFDGPYFGGRIAACDLVCEGVSSGMKATNEQIVSALNTLFGNAPPEFAAGDIVLLKTDRLSDTTKTTAGEDPFPSDSYYFLPIDYFDLTIDAATDPSASLCSGSASEVYYCVARKGSEFGSGFHASGIKNGDMLCWCDASPDTSTRIQQTYPYLSATDTGDASRGKDYIGYDNIYDENGNLKKLDELQSDAAAKQKADEIQRSGDWVVAAKPGGLRVGMLAQAVGGKTKKHTVNGTEVGGEIYTGENENGTGLSKALSSYRKERFPDKADDPAFTVGYYEGNITRTSNNYYLPTIGISSGLGENENIMVDVYLGNNGRLIVADSDLLVTKTVGSLKNAPVDTGRKFNFQVFVDGREGNYNAIVVKAENGENGGQSWSRQLNYADLVLDPKYFLLDTDGTKAMVDTTGRRIVQTGTDEENLPIYVYADEEDKPEAGRIPAENIRYVFVGSNTGTSTLRVYENSANPGVPNAVGPDKINEKINVKQAGAADSATYYAKQVWLFTGAQYDAFTGQQTADGSPEALTGDLGQPELLSAASDGFELLTLSHVTDTLKGSYATDVAVTSPYSTQSPYWSETLTFGLGDSDSLYDETVPNGLSPDIADLAYIKKHTAKFTLTHGYGLLLTGIDMNTIYRVTESITADDQNANYRFKSVTHNVSQDGSYTYTVGPDGLPQSDPQDGSTAQFGENVYSVFGSTGVYEQQAHYLNAYDLDALEVSKTLESGPGADITDKDRNIDFEYTADFTLPEDWSANAEPGYTLGALPYWRGPTADVNKGSSAGGAPAPTDEEAIAALNTLTPDETTGQYTFTLKASESIVIYGLPVGTGYTVTETKNEKYPASETSGTVENHYAVQGTIQKTPVSAAAPGNVVATQVTFTNVKQRLGSLAVEKRIENDNPDVNAEFTFEVKLTAPAGEEPDPADLIVTRYTAGSESGESLATQWTEGAEPDGSKTLTASFTLKHLEKIIIKNIPFGAQYSVSETGAYGYNLQRVEDGNDNNSTLSHDQETKSVTGTITDAGAGVPATADVYLIFVNAQATSLPFTGGLGAEFYILCGALALLTVTAVLAYKKRKKNGHAE